MKRHLLLSTWSFAIAIALQPLAVKAGEIRIKDITEVEGLHTEELVGLGLVVGLNNTGGKSPVTRRFATNMLQRFGNRIDPEVRARLRNDTREKTNNVSVVTVTATLPPMKRVGQKIDITVSAFDDAVSLFGGTLIFTPLYGVDEQVYATASGPVSLDSISAGGAAASVQKNHPTAGRIIDGAQIVETIPSNFVVDGRVHLLLRDPDFETATRISDAINLLAPHSARTLDPSSIEVIVPTTDETNVNGFLAQIHQLRIQPDVRARVVINERTGTIVIGENVRLSRALITHSNLAIFTREQPEVSQPAPFSQGETTVVPRTELDVVEEDRPIHEIEETATVADLAQALNALGVAPRDLGVIFQQLRDAGALHAELEFE
jgi:flagellar P-ring protein precursor FlgI